MNKTNKFLTNPPGIDKVKTIQVGFYLYGILGLFLYLILSKNKAGTAGYFIFGWTFSFINFELQKKGFKALFSFMNATEISRAPSAIYMLLFLKLVLLGIVIAFLVFSNNVLLAPFIVGMASLLFAVVWLALRMLVVKSASRNLETNF